LAAPRAADHAILSRALDDLEEITRQRRTDQALALLQRLVPEYTPPTNADLGSALDKK
jgi:O-antigen biosynthesis protein WbqV